MTVAGLFCELLSDAPFPGTVNLAQCFQRLTPLLAIRRCVVRNVAAIFVAKETARHSVCVNAIAVFTTPAVFGRKCRRYNLDHLSWCWHALERLLDLGKSLLDRRNR